MSTTAVRLTVLTIKLTLEIGTEEKSSAFANRRTTSTSVRSTTNINAQYFIVNCFYCRLLCFCAYPVWLLFTMMRKAQKLKFNTY